ncbi:MAG: NAD(P)-dependent oxidoreductase [Alphaproteobacteria bacterium]|nr:NAD(P)-dependent oxidoreductase [Alphaproteobacteria bacterium]
MTQDRPSPTFNSALVTGATGFIGRRLCERLNACGIRPLALIRTSTDRNRLAAVEAFADIRTIDADPEALATALSSPAPEVTFHLAARYVATHEPHDIADLVSDNVGLTASICEAVTAAGCRNLIYAGTAWQNAGNDPGDPTPNPNTLYAATKQAGDEIIDYYARKRDLNSVTLKIYDSYGPGDTRRKFLTVLAETFTAGRTLEASPGDQRLHIVHVDDLVDGFVHAANLMVTGKLPGRHSHTLPSPDAISLRELADTWMAATGNDVDIAWGATAHRPGEVMVPWEGDPLPGWAPRILLRDGLRDLQV